MSLMNRRAARPDFITFAILWQNMKKQEDPLARTKPEVPEEKFATCRLLMQDMIERTAYLRKKGKEMRRELYELIVISFAYSQDLQGTAVALRALQKYYNVYPDVDTARKIIQQLARLNIVIRQGNNLKLSASPGARKRVEDVTQIFEIIKQKRVEFLKEKGIDFKTLDPELKQKESLTILLDLLRFAYDAMRGDSNITSTNSRSAATRAAIAMGVPECNPWSDAIMPVQS